MDNFPLLKAFRLPVYMLVIYPILMAVSDNQSHLICYTLVRLICDSSVSCASGYMTGAISGAGTFPMITPGFTVLCTVVCLPFVLFIFELSTILPSSINK